MHPTKDVRRKGRKWMGKRGEGVEGKERRLGDKKAVEGREV